MKFKDYYETLGVERDAKPEDIKKAYRKLAHKYHPDVSKEKDAEARFKEVGEAYETLKDPEKRQAYDQLGRHRPGQDFQPPPDWSQHFGGFGGQSFSADFEGVDLGDLFAGLSRGGRGRTRASAPFPGEDYDVTADVDLEDAYSGGEIDLALSYPETDSNGMPRRVPRTFRVRIPKGAQDGQRLRLAGKGAPGHNGGPPGDLYVTISLAPHPIFTPEGSDISLDLPLAPWEAVLGAEVVVPTLDGSVEMKIPAGTRAGRVFRLARKGLGRTDQERGDLLAVVRIVVPENPAESERALYRKLAEGSTFDPRVAWRSRI